MITPSVSRASDSTGMRLITAAGAPVRTRMAKLPSESSCHTRAPSPCALSSSRPVIATSKTLQELLFFGAQCPRGGRHAI
jgi:hypothetical protein